MMKEIGSTFWLNPNSVYEYNYYQKSKNIDDQLSKFGDVAFLSTGRAAQNLVLETIENRNPNIKKRALIPGFTCTTVVKPFKTHGYQIYTYSVDDTLVANLDEIEKQIDGLDIDVILFHRYYGFDTCKKWDRLIEKYSKKGVVFIEDKTQCLYSELPVLNVDYIVGSIRKWDGMPDGGIAICKDGELVNKPKLYDDEMVNCRIKASYLKYDYIFNDKGYKEVFRELYEESADLLYGQKEFYKMHPFSYNFMLSLNEDELKDKRRENYNYLYNAIKNNTKIKLLSPELNIGEVPLYLALLVEDRQELQAILRNKDIYAPMIWPYEDESLKVSDEVMKIYNQVICIPIDQRYDIDDMERAYLCIKQYKGI